MGLEVLIPIFGILLLLVPITGLTAILTLRLGGKPFVESLARELRGFGPEERTELVATVRALAEQVETLQSEVHELRSAQSFDRKLLGAERTPGE